MKSVLQSVPLHVNTPDDKIAAKRFKYILVFTKPLTQTSNAQFYNPIKKVDFFILCGEMNIRPE